MRIIVLFTSIFTANSQEIWNDSLSIGTHRRLDRTNSRYIPPQFGFGLHYLNLYVGNPAQLRTLTVSTSSAFTALPCEDCDDCGMRGSNLYNFSLSSGFTTIPCSAGCSSRTQCFSDRCVIGKSLPDKSSWSGYEVSDFAFHGGGVDSSSIVGTDAAEMFGFQLRFACQKRTRGFYNNVMDGILGLSPAPTSFLSQIHQAGKLEHRRFSLCFNTVDDFKREQATGLVTFGGFKEELLATEMLYAKMIDGNDYKVNVKRIHFRAQNGQSVGSEGQYKVRSIDVSTASNTQASVDSSSPFLTFDSRLEEPFRAAWKEVTGTDFTEARLQLSESDLARMPTLLIELEGDPNSPRELDPSTVTGLTDDFNVLLAVPATHYMERLPTTIRPYRARIQFEKKGGSTLGANVMQGHTISYEPDLLRIGFAESKSCQIRSNTGKRMADGENRVKEGTNSEVDNGQTSIETVKGDSESTPPPIQTSMGTDDMYIAGSSSSESLIGSTQTTGDGSCTTATCRSYLAIGYVFIGTALAVIYRMSRPKDRAIQALTQYTHETEALYHQDISSAYRRRAQPGESDSPVLV